MYRCTCSTRALEAFIADLAGLSIKSRPQSIRRLHVSAAADRTVDAVSLQTSTPEAAQQGLRMIELPPVLEPAPTKDDQLSTSEVHARSKAENRMLRKLKRIQGGSHNKLGDPSAALAGQVQEVLSEIENSSRSNKILEDLVRPKKEQEVKVQKKGKESKGKSWQDIRAAKRTQKEVKELKEKRKEAKEKKRIEHEHRDLDIQEETMHEAEIEEGEAPPPERAVGTKGKNARKRELRAKSSPPPKPSSKSFLAKARQDDLEEQIANELAGEQTVSSGDEQTWEDIQDEWTEEPDLEPDEPEPSRPSRKTSKSNKQLNDEEPTPEKERRPQEPWGIQKSALERKFGSTGWQPRKRLSPDTLSGIRALHASNPTIYNVAMLQEHFKITPEAIRRILKSKWRPNEEEVEARMQRWEKRGVRKWCEMAEQGQKPPKKWREMGVMNPKVGGRKRWDSNRGVVDGREGRGRKEEKGREEAQESLVGKARRLENAQRVGRRESLVGRIL